MASVDQVVPLGHAEPGDSSRLALSSPPLTNGNAHPATNTRSPSWLLHHYSKEEFVHPLLARESDPSIPKHQPSPQGEPSFRDLERRDIDYDWRLTSKVNSDTVPTPLSSAPIGENGFTHRTLERLPPGQDWNSSTKLTNEGLYVDTSPIGPPLQEYRELQSIPAYQDWSLSTKIDRHDGLEPMEPFGPTVHEFRPTDHGYHGSNWNTSTKVKLEHIEYLEPIGVQHSHTFRELESLPFGQEWNSSGKVISERPPLDP